MTNPDIKSSASVTLDGQGGIGVTGALNFDTAVSVLQPVLDAIRESKEVQIDFSGVTHSNSAGLALMMEWSGEARRLEHHLSFKSIPDSLRQLASVCQVDTLI